MRAQNLRADYALTAFYSCLALYGAGAGIANVPLGLALMGLCVAGTAVSYWVNRLDKNGRLEGYAGIAYALAAAAVVFFIVPLNSSLPDGGFPGDLMVAAVMCWFIALGAFFAWSENVMLFQAVPSLSLLSMVGIWETYNGAVLSFVVFLLAVTVLLSRAHTRAMYRMAQHSGYSKLNSIGSGPWKKMAGPEWVLGFAAVVIVVSSIGAPVVQSVFQPLAGNFRDSIPKSLARRFNQSPPVAPLSAVQTNVGTGPHTPGDRVMLLAEIDRPRYLRDGAFELYTGNGWRKDPNAAFPEDRVWQDGNRIYRRVFSQSVMKNPEILKFAILPMSGAVHRVPVPGDAFEIVIHADGNGFRFASGAPNRSPSLRYTGRSYAPNPAVRPSNAVRIEDPAVRDAYTLVATTDRVRAWTDRVTRGRKTDFAKALAIKEAIESTAKYNLKADAVPPNRDAADYFLFESKEGYCDLFATAMTVMARCAGIPARYATGYFPIKNEKDGMGRTVLRASDRHAWAELFFEGVGWIVFDATEGAEEVAGNERGSSGIQLPWYETRAFQLLLNAALASAIVALIALAVTDRLGLKSLPAFLRVRRAAAPGQDELRRELGAQYALLAQAVARSTGMQRPAHASPTEYAEAAAPRLGELGPSVARLTERFVRALFSGADVGADELESIKREVRSLRAELRRIRPEGTRKGLLAQVLRPLGSAVGLLRAIGRLYQLDKRERSR